MSNTRRRPGPDSTLEEAKSTLITTAIELLRERGVDVGLAHISLSDTIERAPVTRSTAYRSLADDKLSPQAVLHHEILTYLLTRYTQADSFTSIGEAVAIQLDLHAEALECGDVARRTQAMRAVIRAGANASYDEVVGSADRAVLMAIYGALQSSSSVDWRHEALAQGEASLTALFAEMYRELTKLFQYRVRPPFTIPQFTTAVASLIEGIAMRHGFNDELAMIERPTGPDGALEPWSLFAVGLESMVIGMFEPVSPDDPFADLVRY